MTATPLPPTAPAADPAQPGAVPVVGPAVEPRDGAAFLAALRARLPGFLPDWPVPAGGPAAAILAVAARYAGTLADRLNRTPAKNELAFLDLLGLSLLPAQAARAPVTFTLPAGLPDTRAPAGSQVGATAPAGPAGPAGPVVFTTEHDIGVAAARLVQAGCVWPAADAYADLSGPLARGEPLPLFGGTGGLAALDPVGHELYVAHPVALALAGRCELRLTVDLATRAAAPIPTAWEYWDGERWAAFAAFADPDAAGDDDSVDGTAGWTRSGVVVLRTPCGSSADTGVDGVTSRWVRARPATPLTGPAVAELPSIGRLAVESVVAPPIGGLTLQASGGELWVAGGLWAGPAVGLSPDPAAATATLRCVSDPPPDPLPPPVTRPLASGWVQFDPVPTTGSYQLTVRIPGFTQGAATFSLAAGAAFDQQTVTAQISGQPPDHAYAGTLPIDLSKPFYPFGQAPTAGTAFSLAADEALAKPGATVTLVLEAATTGREVSGSAAGGDTVTLLTPTLSLRYFDGAAWRPLTASGLAATAFTSTTATAVRFTVPADLAATAVGGVTARWVRVQIDSGLFGATRTTTWKDAANTAHTFVSTEVVPPALARVRVAYSCRTPAGPPTALLARNDFGWTDAGLVGGSLPAPFAPFTAVADPTPALYLGFDAPLPVDLVSLFLAVVEQAGGAAGPDLVWERYDPVAGSWARVAVTDETAGLARPGLAQVSYPGAGVLPAVDVLGGPGPAQLTATGPDAARDAGAFRPGDRVLVGAGTTLAPARLAAVDGAVLQLTAPPAKPLPRGRVERAGLARFGVACPAWLRARQRAAGDPPAPTLAGLYLNAAWASACRAYAAEVLGGSDGNPGQSFRLRYPPVLPGQVVQVRELAGPRAAIDAAALAAEVTAAGGSAADLRVETDGRTGAVTAVWVSWQERPNLDFSGPADRHYTIERSGGRIVFGDDRHGRIPPAGTDNVLAWRYTGGGGSTGNLPAGSITQPLAGVPAATVRDVAAAAGGADAEDATGVLARGPAAVAARLQAVTAADVEVLARQASPAVAVARALPTTDAAGRAVPGCVRVVVLPRSADPMPVPSAELRRQVAGYLARRMAATATGGVTVAGPDYQPVGVDVAVLPADPTLGGPVADAVAAAVTGFLHPLTGGPDGTGFGFGAAVSASDVAAVVVAVPGVDRVPQLAVLVDGVPVGDVAAIPAGRIACAGRVRVSLATPGGSAGPAGGS